MASSQRFCCLFSPVPSRPSSNEMWLTFILAGVCVIFVITRDLGREIIKAKKREWLD